MPVPRPAKASPPKAKAETAGSMPALSLVDRQRAVRERSINRKAGPATGQPTVPTVALSAHPAFAEANDRALEMTKIAAFAEKHGLSFDLSTALKSKLTLQQARDQVTNAMAEADEASPTICTPTTVSAAAASIAQNWDAANAKVAKRLGLRRGQADQ